jgi:hypothetical protein
MASRWKGANECFPALEEDAMEIAVPVPIVGMLAALAHQAKAQGPVGAADENTCAKRATPLYPISDVEGLRSVFNRDKGHPRLVLLLSPTCCVCINGAKWVQKEILAKCTEPRLRVYVVWLPMLPDDDRSKWRLDLLCDPRTMHFWDEDRILGEFFATQSEPRPRSGVQWDAFFPLRP